MKYGSWFLAWGFILFCPGLYGQWGIHSEKFEQLEEEFRAPGKLRNAAGAPGPEYWQNRADYSISLRLDTETPKLAGTASITYHNFSPDPLPYLWMRLPGPGASSKGLNKIQPLMSGLELNRLMASQEGLFQLQLLQDSLGEGLTYVQNGSYLVIDLPEPLQTGKSYRFECVWNLDLSPLAMGTSLGFYPESEQSLAFILSSFFPKVCVYNDISGWQNQTQNSYEAFSHDFGTYVVKIEVPESYTVAATGLLQNPEEVLSPEEYQLFQKMKQSQEPVSIVVPDSTSWVKRERDSLVTWEFWAEDVRDFALSCSRDWIWEAVAYPLDSQHVYLQAFYPPAQKTFYEQYGLQVLSTTLAIYSKCLFTYPYPSASLVHHPDLPARSFPMLAITYKGYEEQGENNEQQRFQIWDQMITQIGASYFPHIINSDESTWGWMDEGLNTFMKGQVERAFHPDFPIQSEVAYVLPYMRTATTGMSPIMTNLAQVQFPEYNTAIKPAVALSILRETIMGAALFDRALQVYAKRWKFKHPTPEDFFRTMEDASGIDLDWFWRGWFYKTDPVDMELNSLRYFKLETDDPDEAEIPRFSFDFIQDSTEAAIPITRFSTDDPKVREQLKDKHFYELVFRNVGGTVMPLVVEFEYGDGSREAHTVPVEIWRKNDRLARKVFVTDKPIQKVNLDPAGLTGDIDVENNGWSIENPGPSTSKYTSGIK